MRKGVPEGSLADATRLASTNSIPQKTDLSTPAVKKYDVKRKKVSREEKLQKENEALKAEAKAERSMREKMAREEAEAAKSERAKRYTKQEIEVAINGIEALTDVEVLSLAKGLELQGMTKARRDDLISKIYIALHEESAKGETGRGSIAVKMLASKIAWDMIDSASIKDADGKIRHFKDIYDEVSLQSLAQELTESLFDSFSNMGEHTSNSYFQSEIRAERERFRQERVKNTKHIIKLFVLIIS